MFRENTVRLFHRSMNSQMKEQTQIKMQVINTNTENYDNMVTVRLIEIERF